MKHQRSANKFVNDIETIKACSTSPADKELFNRLISCLLLASMASISSTGSNYVPLTEYEKGGEN